MAADQLTEEFEASFRVFQQNQQMRFANTEEEMQSQNSELQDELAAAERALKMERNRVPSSQLFKMMNPTSWQCSRKADPNGCTRAFAFGGLGAYTLPA